MLEVVLYRVDRRGRLDLQERNFETLGRLAAFFRSSVGENWDWAEIDGAPRVRYSADELRAIVEAGRPEVWPRDRHDFNIFA
jgi:hypothetical protein